MNKANKEAYKDIFYCACSEAWRWLKSCCADEKAEALCKKELAKAKTLTDIDDILEAAGMFE